MFGEGSTQSATRQRERAVVHRSREERASSSLAFPVKGQVVGIRESTAEIRGDPERSCGKGDLCGWEGFTLTSLRGVECSTLGMKQTYNNL